MADNQPQHVDYVCQYCGEPFNDFDDLGEHVARWHYEGEQPDGVETPSLRAAMREKWDADVPVWGAHSDGGES